MPVTNDLFSIIDLKELENLSEEEKEYALKVLKEYMQGDAEKYNNLLYSDYAEIPVDIHTFLHDKRYLGKGLTDDEGRFTLFPFWEETLKKIFPTPTTTAYNTLILTGAIGIGKTLVAVVCLLYLLYRLLCLKDPYLFYGMQPIDKISISLMNITIENAKGVALDKMNQLILSSEWFLAHGKMAGQTNLKFLPDKHIELICGSSNNQIIGRAIFANFTDEVNWGLTNDVQKLKKKQKQLISQTDARMRSRFLRGTYLPTLNIIASSKNSEQSFLEDYIEGKKKNESKTTLIIDEPQWVVDNRKDTKEKFYVAVGNKFLANELLPLGISEKELDYYRSRGYEILAVPMGYLESFQDNIDTALMDIAGRATASAIKFISGMRWNEIKTDKYRNPFTKEIIQVGNAKEDITQYGDFFDLSAIPVEMKAKPLYIHLDMSKSGDKTGIGGVWQIGKRPTIDGHDATRDMFYRVAFHVSIEAPKGYEISFDKNRAFIRWLKQQGFNIKGVSSDTYQSAQIQQQLVADGFDARTISVDRLDSETKQCLPYAYFRTTIYDRRLEVYTDCKNLTEEVLGLEREVDGHVNHPENGTVGSKDSADAITGALWNASLHIDEFVYDYGETLSVITEMNYATRYDERKQIAVDFEQELTKILDPLQEGQSIVSGGVAPKEPQRKNVTQQGFMDFGFGKAQTPYSQYLANGIIVI